MIRMEEVREEYDLAGQIIGFPMKIHLTLGSGALGSVYQNALALELRRAGFQVEDEKAISVRYEGELIGKFVADLLVNDAVIVETKAIQVLAKIHEVQLVTRLVATGIDEGPLLNFGVERREFKKKFRRPRKQTASV